MTDQPNGPAQGELPGEGGGIDQARKATVQPLLEPVDVNYLMAVKPFLTAKGQTVIELMVNVLSKSGEGMNPGAMLALLSTMGQGGSQLPRADMMASALTPGAGNINPLMALLTLMNAPNGGKK